MSTSGAPPSAGERLLTEPIRLLIADDEEPVRVALIELLGHEEGLLIVGEAADAEEAIAVATERKPDVALVDVKMPAGGGARAAREITRLSPDTRVIALSAFEDKPTVLEMLRAGAVGYLVKGAAAEHILSSIEKVARGGASLSPALIDGIVAELSSQLRREEIEQDAAASHAGEIGRFLSGDGVSMVFQPIVDLSTRDVVGMEALARFHTLPLRPPNEWFAEAVELELGIPLELATIRRALAALPAVPPNAYLSVNCSHRAAMSPSIRSALAPAASRIVVEITEHEAVEDYETLSVALDELRSLGVRIAIDDAGAGYATLRHTLRLRPDIVKVDISLVRAIDSDRAKRALASALISFADELGMAIVAEGIETGAELATLLALGCPYGQGFFLARPAPLH